MRRHRLLASGPPAWGCKRGFLRGRSRAGKRLSFGRVSRRYRPFDPFDRGTGPFDARREIRMPQIPRRFWGGVALFALAVLVFVLASPIVSFITELQWYDALGLRDVYTTRLGLEWSIALASLLLAFAYLAVNVFIALRVRAGPGLRAVGIRRSVLRSTAGWVGLATAAVIAIILAAGASSQWQALALFMHSSPTGTADPVLGQDISFYLLTLPFLHAATNWSLGLDFMAVRLTGALYSWRGGHLHFSPAPPPLAHGSGLITAVSGALFLFAWV